MSGEPWDGRYVVYRIRSVERFLYVGHSRNLEGRIYTEHINRPWWRDVARIKVTIHTDGIEARAVESEEITRLRPQYNIYGRGPRALWTASDYCDVIGAMIIRSQRDIYGTDPRGIAISINRRVKEFADRFPDEASAAGYELVPVPLSRWAQSA